ncbi:MAG: hypothetical protein CMN56_09630 [Sneathiella sp.]|uniref:KAP family P-loop NTPase fold protein n=1 Tax=Sneathiella sp. TaxID=1964365 RepID=UPI000C4E629B|nr:P-loop NTPase fold protein [Sneathiella sp.]MAZ03387.1 hypothetical protein [Sneathiella sp.]
MAENDTETETPAEGIWDDDHLERWKDADFLLLFLKNRIAEKRAADETQSYVLNLDAKWGGGKTFFLTRLQCQLKSEGHLVAYVNAWEDDHATDPLVPIIVEIDKVLKAHIDKNENLKINWAEAKKYGLRIAGSIAKQGINAAILNTTGINADVLVKNLPKDIKKITNNGPELFDHFGAELLETFSKQKTAIKKFKSNLKILLDEIEKLEKEEDKKACVPLFILIDELDRCRPTYAIELLERVKHLFDVDNVVFILATNTDQLQHSIKAVYGGDFDAKRYLYRFFNRTYLFGKPNTNQFVEHLYKQHLSDIDILSSPFEDFTDEELKLKFLQCTFSSFPLEPRDIEQCFELLRNIITIWRKKARIELIIMVPLIILFQQKRAFDDLDFSHSIKELLSSSIWANNYNLPSPRKSFVSIHSVKSGKNINLLNLFLNAWKRSNETYSQSRAEFYESTDFASIEEQWTIKILNDEFQRENYHHNYSGLSIIAQYPRLISSAGQLVDLSKDDD